MGRKPNLKLYEEQEHTIKEISSAIGCSKYLLYGYINGRYSVKGMPIDKVIAMAKYEELDPLKLYNLMVDYEVKHG